MVLFSAINDWANLGYMFSRCLRAVGVPSCAVAYRPHEFYDEQATILQSNDEYLLYAGSAEAVVLMHSEPMRIQAPHTFKVYQDREIWVFHGGTAYRRNYKMLNQIFQDVKGTLIQTGDLLGLGAVNEHWILPPFNECIKPDYKYRGHKFAHFPRHPQIKGSDVIQQTLSGKSFACDAKLLKWDDNIRRMRECDIYIEQLAPPYEWGITALEAAALGKVVITQFQSLGRYEQEYGDCELIVANNAEELKEAVEMVSGWSRARLQHKKRRTRRWVEKNHSYLAVGRRLKKLLNE